MPRLHECILDTRRSPWVRHSLRQRQTAVQLLFAPFYAVAAKSLRVAFTTGQHMLTVSLSGGSPNSRATFG